jgi:hypothetical protein
VCFPARGCGVALRLPCSLTHFDCAPPPPPQDDALRAPECQLLFGAAGGAEGERSALLQPELLLRDEATGSLEPLLLGALPFPDMEPGARTTRSVWARWAQPCAPQSLTAVLTCSTDRGAARLEATAAVRLLRGRVFFRACATD